MENNSLYHAGYHDAVDSMRKFLNDWFQQKLDAESGEYRIKWLMECYIRFSHDFHEMFEMEWILSDTKI